MLAWRILVVTIVQNGMSQQLRAFVSVDGIEVAPARRREAMRHPCRIGANQSGGGFTSAGSGPLSAEKWARYCRKQSERLKGS
jgi:hypothetical protein